MLKDKAILFLAIAQTLVWAGLYYIFPAMLLRWEQSLGWHRTDITAAITGAILISALTSPFSGRLTDAGLGPQMMTISTIIGALCLLGLSWVTEITHFYLLSGLIGVMLAGCLYEPCFALITRARGRSAKQSIIWITLLAGFASTISFPGVHALSEWFGWRIALQVFALVILFIAAPLMWFGAVAIERSGVSHRLDQVASAERQNAFLSRPVFWILAIGLASAALVHSVTLQHLLPILFDRGIKPELAIITASFIGPMQVAGRVGMMMFGGRLSNHAIAIGCFVILGCSIPLLMGSAHISLLLAGFVILFGVGHGMVSIMRPLVTRDILGDRNFGAKSGALALFYLVGSGSAPYLGSLVWGYGGYDLVLPCLIVIAAIGLGLYLISFRLSKNSGPGLA